MDTLSFDLFLPHIQKKALNSPQEARVCILSQCKYQNQEFQNTCLPQDQKVDKFNSYGSTQAK